ncbi:MAG: hypothetical protein ACFFBD_21875 [Candidatus Hodarchaeota archaeon]
MLNQLTATGLLSFQLNIDTLWLGIADFLARLYESFLNFENLFFQLVILILAYAIFEILGWIFPAFNRLLNVIFLPFRLLHTYAHIAMTHYLSENETQLPPNQRTSVFPVLSVALDREDSTSAGIRPSSTRAAYKIANAPAIIGVVLFFVFLSSGQIILASKSVLLDLLLQDRISLWVVYLVHFYLFFGITRVWPSMEDYNVVLLMYMTRSHLSPFFIAWALIVFSLTFTADLLITRNVISALIFGILFAIAYVIAYITMISYLDQEPAVKLDWAELEEAERRQIQIDNKILDSNYEEIDSWN